MVDFISLIFTLWASGYASGYDPTGRFQLRPNKAGEPEASMTLRAALTAPFSIKGLA
jgi:hypothetical protein